LCGPSGWTVSGSCRPTGRRQVIACWMRRRRGLFDTSRTSWSTTGCGAEVAACSPPIWPPLRRTGRSLGNAAAGGSSGPVARCWSTHPLTARQSSAGLRATPFSPHSPRPSAFTDSGRLKERPSTTSGEAVDGRRAIRCPGTRHPAPGWVCVVIDVFREEVADGLVLRSVRGRLALAATVAASAMASLDATVVHVALPHIGQEFGASVSALQWVLTGYLLALASLILLGGALGDRFGRRRVFVIGTIWFAAASLLCGAAPNVAVLTAARILQGVGG